ncbi:MAG TPA: hypothetical protein VK427_01500, partial [Kofleriaceae bacterium]|nr:hypothetical protein [Kofleriaceae bacterium]
DGALSTELGARVAPAVSRVAGMVAPRATRVGTFEYAPLSADEPDSFDGAEAATWLNENLFTDANHTGDGIYKIPSSLVCDDADRDCLEGVAQLQPRIRVTENGDALKFSLQLGKNHDEPLAVGLSTTSLSLTVNLDEVEDVLGSMGGTSGDDMLSLAGAVTGKLEVLGAAKAKLSVDIDRKVAVELGTARFSSEKAQVFAVTLDGNAQSMVASLGLGETKLNLADDFETADFDLPGLAATATFAAGQPLKVNGISMGNRTTTLRRNGQLALALDLNPNDGRALDAQLADDVLSVSPRLDLRAQVNHAVLDDEAPVYDVTRLFLDGTVRGREDALEVVTGSLAIETNPARFGVTASAGQCVRGTDVIDTTSDEVYTQLAVGRCN